MIWSRVIRWQAGPLNRGRPFFGLMLVQESKSVSVMGGLVLLR